MSIIERTASGDIIGHGDSTRVPTPPIMLRLLIPAAEAPVADLETIYSIYHRYTRMVAPRSDHDTGPAHWSEFTEHDGGWLAGSMEWLEQQTAPDWHTQTISRERIEQFTAAYHLWCDRPQRTTRRR